MFPSADQRETYADRDALLASLGFRSYGGYMASNLWAGIKERVINSLGKTCYLCPRPVFAVHHDRYTKENLDGTSLEHLYPVCKKCHLQVEFSSEGKTLEKRTLLGAQFKFRKMVKAKNNKPKKTKQRCVDCGFPARKGHERCRPCGRVHRSKNETGR